MSVKIKARQTPTHIIHEMFKFCSALSVCKSHNGYPTYASDCIIVHVNGLSWRDPLFAKTCNLLMQTHSTFIPSTLPSSKITFLVVFGRSKEKRLPTHVALPTSVCKCHRRCKFESPTKNVVPTIILKYLITTSTTLMKSSSCMHKFFIYDNIL